MDSPELLFTEDWKNMAYKTFRLNAIIRVIILSASIFLLFYLIFRTELYTTTVILGIVIILQVVSIIHYFEKTNKELVRFFKSIKYSDFSQTFKAKGFGSWFDELHDAFSDIMEEFKKTRSEKEEHYRYLQTVVEHIGVGLISFTQSGEVGLFNNAAKRLLNLPRLKNIKQLSSFSDELVNNLFELRSGDKRIVKIELANDVMQLAVYATEFKMRGQHFTLVSIQNIQSELEEQEMEAWQKLIRVLTHEIMNSVTPISSLASTTNEMLVDTITRQKGSDFSKDEDFDDIQGALKTIEKRSKGLINFVNAYRNLTIIPPPNFQIIKLTELFDRIKKLMITSINEKNINFYMNVEPESLELTADPELVEQVLINLILNAVHALDSGSNSKIELTAEVNETGRIIIQVWDNGPGIPDDMKERIFIPFFTTKKQGSGIGLSLSKQIMRLHKGSISVKSIPDKETVFTLRF